MPPLPLSKVTIEEQTGKKRKVELQGPGQPFQGTAWTGEMRLVTDAVNGNDDDAIQQVLGPQDIASTWEGMWRTTKLAGKPALYSEGSGAPQKIALASTLADLFDDIRRSGHLCRVVWSQGPRKVERLGRLARLALKYDRFDDIGWEMEWAWIGRGPARQSVANFRQDQKAALAKSVALQLGLLNAEINAAKLITSKTNVPFSASSFSLGSLEALLDAPKALMGSFSRFAVQLSSRITELGKLIEGFESLPADLASQALDAATNIVTACAQFHQDVTVYGPESLTAFDQSASVQGLVAASSYFDGAAQQAESAMQMAAELRLAAQKARASAPSTSSQGTSTPDVLAVVIARQGDTFASLAAKYLQDVDKGDAIAKANGLPGYQVAPAPGSVVVIPNAQAVKQLTS